MHIVIEILMNRGELHESGPTLSSSIYRSLDSETGDRALRISLILRSSEPSIVSSTSFNNLYEDLYRTLIALGGGSKFEKWQDKFRG